MTKINLKLNTNFLDLWGLTRKSYFFWVAILISLALIYFEINFNIDLLNSISDPKSSIEDAKNLSIQGKLLASIGIAWSIGRGLLNHKRPALVSFMFVGILAAIIYTGLDFLYGKAISSLPPTMKKSGLELLAYRNGLLTGEYEDKEIPLPVNHPVIGKIFMGSFPIAVIDGRFSFIAGDFYNLRQKDIVNNGHEKAEDKWQEYHSRMGEIRTAHGNYLENANIANGKGDTDSQWRGYGQSMQEISSQYQQYINTSNVASGRTSNESDWVKYNTKMQSILSSHEEFVSGSRKALSYGNRGISKFREQSGGLNPNPNISRGEFVKLIRKSSSPKAQEFRDFENQIIATGANGRAIYGRDMPLFMSKSEFNQWNTNIAREILKSKGLSPRPDISQKQFIQMLRQSDGKAGDQFRAREHAALEKVISGVPVPIKEIPYFMAKSQFEAWYAGLAKDALLSRGLEIDPEISIQDFLIMLRKSNTEEGETLRRNESKTIIDEKTAAKYPGIKPLYVKDVPYFMSHEQYQAWYKSKSGQFIEKTVPTVENINEFGNIDDISAAIYLPPLAIISSLTSAVANSIALVISLIVFSLGLWKNSKALSVRLQKYNALLVISAFLILFAALPNNVFTKDTPQIYDLENKLHDKLGLPSIAWSRLSNLQKYVLEIYANGSK